MPTPDLTPLQKDALRRMSLVTPQSTGRPNPLVAPEAAQQGTRGEAIKMFGSG